MSFIEDLKSIEDDIAAGTRGEGLTEGPGHHPTDGRAFHRYSWPLTDAR